jgi:DNA polymerase bacteriophage-type
MDLELQDALHLDLETRSIINLRVSGPWTYGEHWSTSVWVACFARGDAEPEHWYPGMPLPLTIVQAVFDGVPWVAHNAGFERALLHTHLVPKHGWPSIPVKQWVCTASLAAAASLPRDLAGVARTLGCGEQKDMEGNTLIKKMMKPSRTRHVPCRLCGVPGCDHSDEFKLELDWYETADAIARGTDYCKQDVRAERAVGLRLPALSPVEREVWLMDQRANDRGVRLDLPMIRKSVVVVKDAMTLLNDKTSDLTIGPYTATQHGGKLTNAAKGLATTQVQKLRMWMAIEGMYIQDLSAQTIRDILMDTPALDAGIKMALELRQEAAKSSTAKLNAYLNRVCADEIMRDNLMYCAAHSGRWGGRGAQLQNLPSRFTIKGHEIAAGLAMIEAGWPAHMIRAFVGSPLEVISAALRGMVIARDGCEFVAADYNAIEARGTAWLFSAPGLLGVFARGEDPYLYQASKTYGIPLETMSPKTHARERASGKIQVLALGYGMGPDKYIATCWKERILVTREQAVRDVGAYREGNPEIRDGWHELDRAVFTAVAERDKPVAACNGKLQFLCRGSWLYMLLPSGRMLYYPQPKIEKRQMRWLDPETGKPAQKWCVTYLGNDAITHKWGRQMMYGGRTTENAVQAICRDRLAYSMLRLDAAGYPPVLSIHDEPIAEVPEGFGNQHDEWDEKEKVMRPCEFERIISQPFDWDRGFPVAAAGWRSKRLKK